MMSVPSLSSLPNIVATEAGVAVEGAGFFLENAWLIPAIPAASFMMILFFGKRFPYKGSEIGIVAVGLSFLLACAAGIQWIGQVDGAAAKYDAEHGGEEAVVDGISSFAPAVESGGAPDVGVSAVHRTIDWWVNGGVDFKVGILVDGLTVMMLFVVTAISLLVHVYSTDYVDGDRRYTHFFAFLSLFTAAMLFFVLSENILQMIVGWELVGVCSFALIGHWWEDQANSLSLIHI